MKIQYLIIIFLAIMLPIVLVLSEYIGLQIDSISQVNKYDSALLGATFDMMSAFDINTRNVENSDALGEEIREIEAVINTFSASLASSLGLTGAAKDYILSHIPGIAICLYDGYYMYTPDSGTNNNSDANLKSYVYYTKTYENGADTNITIAYSLDNYVSIYGTYGGKSISEAGYLVVCDNKNSNIGVYVSPDFAYVYESDNYKVIQGEVKYNGIEITGETIYENEPATNSVSANLTSKYTTDAMIYYYEAYRFTHIYNEVIGHLTEDDKTKLLITEKNNPESETAPFMDEKVNVIQDTLTKGIREAVYKYKGSISSEYEIPQLTGEDWDKILNNISIVSFMMDLPLNNMTTYNKYVIVNSTTNQKYISPKSIDFIGYGTNNNSLGYYHKITCEDLINEIQNGNINNIIGYASVDFERYKMGYTNNQGIQDYTYYYKHNEYAGYECEVSSIGNVNVAEIGSYLDKYELSEVNKNNILKSYYSAVGRIRFGLTKASSYIRMSNSYSEVLGSKTRKCEATLKMNGTDKTIDSTYGRLIITNSIDTSGKTFKCWEINGIEINGNCTIYYNEVTKNSNDVLNITLNAKYI